MEFFESTRCFGIHQGSLHIGDVSGRRRASRGWNWGDEAVAGKVPQKLLVLFYFLIAAKANLSAELIY